MTCRTSLTRTASSIAVLAALAAGPAAADVTGTQVWSDWKSYMAGFGYEMTGTETEGDGTLVVTDIAMTFEVPESGGNFVITLPSVTFTDNSDGTVSVELPEIMPMTFDLDPPDGEAVKGTINYAQTAPTLTVSGEEADMTYTYTYDAEAVSMTLADFEVDGEPVTTEMLDVTLELTDVSNVTRTQVGELRTYTQEMTAAALNYDVAFVVPEEEGGGRGSFIGSMEGLRSNATGDLPLESSGSEMDAMLQQGMNMTGGFSYDAGRTQIDMQPPEGPLVGSTSSDGGTIDVSFGPDGLSYDVTQTNLAIDMQQVPDLPFPVSLQMAKSAFNLTMPVLPREEAQDFAFGFTLGDFTITDTIWNLFDPAGQLPRDPATISVDLTGKAKLDTNILDPEAAAAMQPGEAPGEVEALDINNLLVSAVGAKLTGSGGFTFDNSDTTTFNGMPKPQGSLDVRLEGANALIDKLVQMGLLPEEQAQGARMMMGLFGVPQGEDVLTSTIEVNEEGHVLANGQRLQ